MLPEYQKDGGKSVGQKTFLRNNGRTLPKFGKRYQLRDSRNLANPKKDTKKFMPRHIIRLLKTKGKE